MPNVTPNPFNNIIPGVGSSIHEAEQAAQSAMCAGRVIGKLERFNNSLDGLEKMNADFRDLLEELDSKLGNAPTVSVATCGGAGEKSPSSVPSLESSVCKLQTQEERLSRNISRLRSLLNSL